ncbi:hypothetical protein AAFF_G00012440 [Aldrovandia affinis]|uniref:Uncharacterized protein n=1 Tax=Aldrovandia affinis TaxID=143900 RepID=A0AAD7S8X1_9TELE|nr:hypothetical protein AAFF_G00012440 [Aldrovandia affinis]
MTPRGASAPDAFAKKLRRESYRTHGRAETPRSRKSVQVCTKVHRSADVRRSSRPEGFLKRRLGACTHRTVAQTGRRDLPCCACHSAPTQPINFVPSL